MRSTLKTSVLGVAVALSLVACAQNAPAPAAPSSAPAAAAAPVAAGPMMGQQGGWWGNKGQRVTPEQMQQRFDQRVAAEANALHITPAQKPHWDAYVQARKGMMAPMLAQGGPQARWQKMQNMTADQRAQYHADQMAERSRQMQKVADTTKALRNALTPKQRAQFDKLHQPGAHKGYGGYMMGGQRGGMGPGYMQWAQ